MKTIASISLKITLSLFILASLILSGCSDDDDNGGGDLKGLVSFRADPDFANDQLIFQAQIQFGQVGSAVTIPYVVRDGSTVIEEGTSSTQNADAGLGIFFETGVIEIELLQSTYSGRMITVVLDPDNTVTADEYTSEAEIELWKTETITIP